MDEQTRSKGENIWMRDKNNPHHEFSVGSEKLRIRQRVTDYAPPAAGRV